MKASVHRATDNWRSNREDEIVEFDTLDELLEYIKKAQHDYDADGCILYCDKDGNWQMEIYDDYRE